MLKFIFVAVLAVGVLGEYTITDEHREQVKNAITEACKKANAEDKVADVENALVAFKGCISGLINFDTIKQEIEEAKPNGALDEVFKKYCAKSSQLKTCISTALNGVTPCIPNEYRQHIPTATNATDQLIDFVCYKDGDRIALFIAEEGPKCFQDKMSSIQACGESLKSSVGNVETAKALPLADKCKKYDDLSKCIVDALETCENPTPGNMAESLFKFVRKASPCPKK